MARTAFEVANGDNHDLRGGEPVDDLIRETPNQDTTSLGIVAIDRADFGLCLDQRHQLGDGIQERATQNLSPRFVPADRVDQLLRRRLADANRARHRPRSSLSIRRFTSSQGSSFTVPASIAATRRAISASHAASASA